MIVDFNTNAADLEFATFEVDIERLGCPGGSWGNHSALDAPSQIDHMLSSLAAL
jgi:hypothetical protein